VIYNDGHTKAYEGEIKNGLPHGKGLIYLDHGKVVNALWESGIDVSRIAQKN
jgi:antitoxin component YwqK of YwqJK toxin-antitoxin module